MTTATLTGQPTRRGRFGRFALHFFEMCAPMCVGFAIGDLVVVAERLLELVPEVPTPVWAATRSAPGRCGTRTR
jgi:hypothetical protein